MMKTMSRRAALAGAGALAAAGGARAQDRRQITIIVPFPPGGASDAIARYFAQKLQERRGGAPVLVVNRPGAAAAIGTEAAAKAAPDGNTILLGAAYFSTAPHLFANLPYDPERDFTPLGVGMSIPLTLYASSAFGTKTLAEVLAKLRAAPPNTYNFASAGQATLAHIGSALFMNLTGTKLTHVPYQGTAPAMTDVVGGQAQLIIDGVAAGMGFVESGRLAPIVMTGAARHPKFPNTPTAAEAGLPGFVVETWNAFFVPSGTPKAIADQLAADFAAIGNEPSVRQWLTERNFEPLVESPDVFRQRMARESGRWRDVIRAEGIKVE